MGQLPALHPTTASDPSNGHDGVPTTRTAQEAIENKASMRLLPYEEDPL